MTEKQAERVIELLEYIALNSQIVAKVATGTANHFQLKPFIDPFAPTVPAGLEKHLPRH
jgi:hypothetical protein